MPENSILSNLLCCAVTSGFKLTNLTYVNWIMMALKTGLLSIVVTGSINAILYRR